MNSNLANLLERIRSRLPEREVALTPGELYYCHSFEKPEGAEIGDLAEFAELSLESVSPFPLETLAWGFVPDGRNRLLVYAASAERLSRRHENLDVVWHALPSFAPMLGKTVERDTLRFVSAGNSISALFIRAGASAPHRVVSRPLPQREDGAPLTENELLEARDALARAMQPNGHEPERGLWRCVRAEVSGEQKVCFAVTRLLPDGNAQEQTFDWPYAGAELWNADVRGRIFAARVKVQRKRAVWAWWGFAAAGAFLALLILGQLGLWGLGLWTRQLENKADSRAAEVMLLQSKNDFAEVLENVTEREMKPFAMLQAANTVRPSGIYFERIGTAEWNVLRIEGQGRRAEEVTSYIEQLRSSPLIENVRNVRTETRGGRTSFDLEAVFVSPPDLEPLPPREPETAPAEEEGAPPSDVGESELSTGEVEPAVEEFIEGEGEAGPDTDAQLQQEESGEYTQ